MATRFDYSPYAGIGSMPAPMLVIGDVVEIEEFAYGYDDQGNYYTDILVWRARVIETPEPSVYPQPRDEVLIYTEHGNYWAGVQERITVLSQV